MSVWRVKYVHLADRSARYPFFKRSVMVAADTRAGAIAKVRAFHTAAHYGEFSASKVEGGKADYQFL